MSMKSEIHDGGWRLFTMMAQNDLLPFKDVAKKHSIELPCKYRQFVLAGKSLKPRLANSPQRWGLKRKLAVGLDEKTGSSR